MNLSHLPNDVIAMILCDFVHIPSLLFQDNWTDAKPKTQKAYTIYCICRYVRNDVLRSRPNYDYDYHCINNLPFADNYDPEIIFMIPYFVIINYREDLKYIHVEKLKCQQNTMQLFDYYEKILPHIESLLDMFKYDITLINTIIYNLSDSLRTVKLTITRDHNMGDIYDVIERYVDIFDAHSPRILKCNSIVIGKIVPIRRVNIMTHDRVMIIWKNMVGMNFECTVAIKSGERVKSMVKSIMDIIGDDDVDPAFLKHIILRKGVCKYHIKLYNDHRHIYRFLQHYKRYLYKDMLIYPHINNIIVSKSNRYTYKTFLHNLTHNHYKKCHMIFSNEYATYNYKNLYEALTIHPDELKIFDKYYNLMYDKVHKTLLYNDFFC